MIMRDIEHEIHLLLIEYEVMRKGEILNHFEKKRHRTVGRALKKLVEKGDIDYGKVRGSKGKWQKYFLVEENTKNNLLLETVVHPNTKHWKHKRVPITQRNLSKLISQEIQFYRKTELEDIQNIKSSLDLHGYISYHVAMITECLKSISQLTWAINSGMLGNSKTKLALAQRNKARYEEFLQKIVYNLSTRSNPYYKKLMKAISKLIYNEIMDSMIYERTTSRIGKGRKYFQIDKKSKYYF